MAEPQPGDSSEAPTTATIEAQLERVLGSRRFGNSRKLAAFLRFATEQALAGRPDQINQASIAAHVYERADFDPRKDPLVRVEANRLRKALDRYYAEEGQDDPVLLEIPLRTYVPRFSFRDAAEQARRLRATEGWQLPAVAVLPFGHSASDEAESIQLEEILTSDLSRFAAIRVHAYRANQPSPHLGNLENARALGLDFAVTGAVRSYGNQIRIDAAVLDVSTGEQFWSGRFDSDASGSASFDMQYVVSRKIAAQVADVYGAILTRVRVNLQRADAADLPAPGAPEDGLMAITRAALTFYNSQFAPSSQTLAETRQMLARAAPYAERSALYWAVLAFNQADSILFDDHPPAATLAAALANVRHAAALDPTSPTVQYARAFISMLIDDKDSVADACRRMLDANPNSGFITGTAAFFLATIGEYDQAITRYRDSIELNPRYPFWFQLVPCFYHLIRSEYEMALRAANQIDMRSFFWRQLLTASISGYLGRKDAAAEELSRLQQSLPDFAARHREIISIYALDPAMAIKLERGLELAGVALPRSQA